MAKTRLDLGRSPHKQAADHPESEDSGVKLTDISEIVAKYAVVDRVFEGDDEIGPEEIEEQPAPARTAAPLDNRRFDAEGSRDDRGLDAEDLFVARGQDDGAGRIPEDEAARFREEDEAARFREEEAARIREDEAARIREDEAARIREDEAARIREEEAARIREDEAMRMREEEAARIREEEAARIHEEKFRLPERPRIVFRRPSASDELYSNWSDTAGRAVDDIKSSYLHDVPSHEYEREPEAPEPQVVRSHKRKLIRSIGVTVGVPIIGGALFALVLYMQKDAVPSDLWGWLSGPTTSTTANNTGPTPNFAEHPETRTETATPDPAAPESGIKLAVPDEAPASDPDGQETAESSDTSPNPVYMARLTVSDSQGSALEPIPLSLAVAPGTPEQRLRIRVSGLPEGAKLSNGTGLGNGEWLLQEQDLEDLTMTLAPDFSGQITLLAEVIDDATHIQAAPSQTVAVNVTGEQLVVQPTGANANTPQTLAEGDEDPDLNQPDSPTETVQQSSPFSELRVVAPAADPPQRTAALTPPAEAEPPASNESRIAPSAKVPGAFDNALLDKGDKLLSNGDISAARLLYKRAFKKGDPRAATAIGKSYDPLVFQQLNVHGVQPDPNRAIEWYRRGAEAGDSSADSYIQALSSWLKN